jgi:hypothetical protein
VSLGELQGPFVVSDGEDSHRLLLGLRLVLVLFNAHTVPVALGDEEALEGGVDRLTWRSATLGRAVTALGISGASNSRPCQ